MLYIEIIKVRDLDVLPNARYTQSHGKWAEKDRNFAVTLTIEPVFMRVTREGVKIMVVAISHFVGNEPSRKVIERAGFIFEGVMPCGFKRFDGEIFDNVCYSILRSEYDTGLISSVRRMR